MLQCKHEGNATLLTKRIFFGVKVIVNLIILFTLTSKLGVVVQCLTQYSHLYSIYYQKVIGESS